MSDTQTPPVPTKTGYPTQQPRATATAEQESPAAAESDTQPPPNPPKTGFPKVNPPESDTSK